MDLVKCKGFNADLAGVLAMLNQPLPIQLGDVSLCAAREHSPRGSGSVTGLSAGGSAGLDLEIRRGERIGLIGTGSGKSTTVDLLMGLLAPTAGRLLVDGVDLHDPVSAAAGGLARSDCTCSSEHLPGRQLNRREHCLWFSFQQIDMARGSRQLNRLSLPASLKAPQRATRALWGREVFV